MSESEFLMWVHSRLVSKHKEPPAADYMQRLNKIVERARKREDLLRELDRADAEMEAARARKEGLVQELRRLKS